jgi:hypothetical protein
MFSSVQEEISDEIFTNLKISKYKYTRMSAPDLRILIGLYS